MAKSQQWNTLLPSVIKYMAKPSSAVPQFTEVQINKPSYFQIRLFTAKGSLALLFFKIFQFLVLFFTFDQSQILMHTDKKKH